MIVVGRLGVFLFQVQKWLKIIVAAEVIHRSTLKIPIEARVVAVSDAPVITLHIKAYAARWQREGVRVPFT